MSFYIYENWTAEKKAVIHKGDCSFCDNGRGVHENVRGDRNGKWRGPFESYQGAKNIAESLGDRQVRDCKKCQSQLEVSK